jgi:DNA-binding cell septation regulator SpoVG
MSIILWAGFYQSLSWANNFCRDEITGEISPWTSIVLDRPNVRNGLASATVGYKNEITLTKILVTNVNQIQVLFPDYFSVSKSEMNILSRLIRACVEKSTQFFKNDFLPFRCDTLLHGLQLTSGPPLITGASTYESLAVDQGILFYSQVTFDRSLRISHIGIKQSENRDFLLFPVDESRPGIFTASAGISSKMAEVLEVSPKFPATVAREKVPSVRKLKFYPERESESGPVKFLGRFEVELNNEVVIREVRLFGDGKRLRWVTYPYSIDRQGKPRFLVQPDLTARSVIESAIVSFYRKPNRIGPVTSRSQRFAVAPLKTSFSDLVVRKQEHRDIWGTASFSVNNSLQVIGTTVFYDGNVNYPYLSQAANPVFTFSQGSAAETELSERIRAAR